MSRIVPILFMILPIVHAPANGQQRHPRFDSAHDAATPFAMSSVDAAINHRRDNSVLLLIPAGLIGGAVGFATFTLLPAMMCMDSPSEAWMGCESTKIAGILGPTLTVPEAVFFANGHWKDKQRFRKTLLVSAALGLAGYGIGKITGDLDGADFPTTYLILPVIQTTASIYVEKGITRKQEMSRRQ